MHTKSSSEANLLHKDELCFALLQCYIFGDKRQSVKQSSSFCNQSFFRGWTLLAQSYNMCNINECLSRLCAIIYDSLTDLENCVGWDWIIARHIIIK